MQATDTSSSMGLLKMTTWTASVRQLAWLAPGLLVYALCRVPSFFEPHWYTDEAGYATTARMLLRGLPLYSQAWTNKPPLHIWAVALPFGLFGPNEAGFHALTFLSGVLALVAVAVLARHYLSARRAMVALIAFGLALGLPLFQAALLVPESLLIAPVSWAAVIVLTGVLREPGPARLGWRWAALAGALIGIALGIQQTALADAVVFGVMIALVAGATSRVVAAYVLALLTVVAAWLVPALAVAGAPAVLFALVGFYREYVQFGLPSHPFFIGLRLFAPLLAMVGAIIARRLAPKTWPLWLWASAELGVSAVANRPYPHFLIPALAPTILALATLPAWSRVPALGRRLAIRRGLIPLALGFALTLPLALSSGTDFNALLSYATWPVAQLRHDQAGWSKGLDQRSPADEATAAWIREHGLGQSTAVVWSSSAWLYLLADLPLALPTAPIYNNVVLQGGSAAMVASRVAALRPQLIVTSEEALSQWPEIAPVLARDYYLAHETYPNKVYLRRAG
jgi:dolichyl-phosphate-mannose-protein mannosyltransferase